MAAMIDRLRADHANLARLLALLEQQAAVIEGGASGDLRLLTDILDYIASYPDLYHHPREDLVFETLRHRDSASIETINALLRQHKDLTNRAVELANALAAFSGSTVVPRERLVGLLRDYVALSRTHMNLEESTVFPRAGATLTEQDWQVIEQGMAIEDDPLFGHVISEQYRSLYDTIMREAVPSEGTG